MRICADPCRACSASRGIEVIVVDCGCPDGAAEVVTRDFPSACVLVRGDPDFSMSVARNAGAEAALGDWLIFLDADIIVAEDFGTRLDRAIAAEDCFYRFGLFGADRVGIFGSFAVRRCDFDSISGYDEAMQGYGGADADLYFRLGLLDLRGIFLDEELVIEVLQHSDADRTRFYRRKSVTESQLVNCTYRQVKNLLLRQMHVAELPLAMRRELYASVDRRVTEALEKSETHVGFVVPLPDDPAIMPFDDWVLLPRIVVDLVARHTLPGRR